MSLDADAVMSPSLVAIEIAVSNPIPNLKHALPCHPQHLPLLHLGISRRSLRVSLLHLLMLSAFPPLPTCRIGLPLILWSVSSQSPGHPLLCCSSMAKVEKTKVLGGIEVAGKKRSAHVSARLASQKGQTKVASSSTRDSEDSGTGVESSAPASSKSYSLSRSDFRPPSDESDSSESTECVIEGARARPFPPAICRRT